MFFRWYFPNPVKLFFSAIRSDSRPRNAIHYRHVELEQTGHVPDDEEDIRNWWRKHRPKFNSVQRPNIVYLESRRVLFVFATAEHSSRRTTFIPSKTFILIILFNLILLCVVRNILCSLNSSFGQRLLFPITLCFKTIVFTIR